MSNPGGDDGWEEVRKKGARPKTKPSASNQPRGRGRGQVQAGGGRGQNQASGGRGQNQASGVRDQYQASGVRDQYQAGVGPGFQQLKIGSQSNPRGASGGYRSRGGGRGGFGGDRQPQEPRQPSDELNRLLAEGESLMPGMSEFVQRPGYVDNFVKLIPVFTNHYGISIPDECFVWMYDVEITETTQRDPAKRVSKEKAKMAFEQFLLDDYNSELDEKIFHDFQNQKSIIPVCDGYKILYTSGKLADDFKQRNVVVYETDGEIPATDLNKLMFVVSLKFVKKLNLGLLNRDNILNELEPLLYENELSLNMALNAVMKYGPEKSKIAVGPNRLFPVDGIVCNGYNDLGGGAIAVDGHFQSVRPSGKGRAVVVNQATAAFFPNMDLLSLMRYVLNPKHPNLANDGLIANALRDNQSDLMKVLRNLTLETTHNGYPKKYRNFIRVRNIPSMEFITLTDGRIVSLAKYFEENYGSWLNDKGINLQENNTLPCLEFRTGTAGQFKINLIPIQLLRLKPNQQFPGILQGNQQREMIRKTAIKPEDRFRNIDAFSAAIKTESQPLAGELGIELSQDPKKAPGKILKPPTVEYGGKDQVEVLEPGKWSMQDHRGNSKSFCVGAPLKNWIVFGNRDRSNSRDSFIEMIINSSAKYGMDAEQPLATADWVYGGKTTVEELFKEAKKIFDRNRVTGGHKLVLIYAKELSKMRDEIKALGETADYGYGYFTQVIDNSKVFTKSKYGGIDQYVSNVLLKMNVKLGGCNHVIAPISMPLCLKPEKKVMVIGADVTHAHHNVGDSSKSVPISIAAVCASYEPSCTKFCTLTTVQEKPTGRRQQSQEIIKSIGKLIKEALENYKDENGYYPDHIIYNRDGVSEGQFATVLNEEINHGIESALDDIGLRPEITVIIVAKRGQTWIRPEFRQDGIGKSGNVPAGTLVDTTITHPNDFDFWLVSHEGIQGTSKPSHYTVIRDDHHFDANELALLTNYLCYTFVRCTRSISNPSPVRYADLAATRATSYLKSESSRLPPIQLNTFSYTDSDQVKDRKERENDEMISEHIALMNNIIKVVPSMRTTLYYC